MFTSPAAGSGTRTRAAALLVVGAASALLTACATDSATAGPGITSARAPRSSDASAAASSPAASPATAAAQTVPIGATATLPSDTFVVSRFLGTAAPAARKPDTPGTHWASFEVKQCAVTDSRMGTWKVALADGSFASEPTTWPEELPHVLLPYDETIPPGTCVGGRVYVAMPDGATATAVVLEPRELNPTRPEVQWVIGRTSAAS